MWEKPLIIRRKEVWYTANLCCSPLLRLWGRPSSIPPPTGLLPGSGAFGAGAQRWEVSRDHGKDGNRAQEQEGLWKGTPCKPRLLFQGLEEGSCDPGGVSDETVERITNSTPAGAIEYTEDIFSHWTLTYTYVHWSVFWKMLHFLLKTTATSFFFFLFQTGEKNHHSVNRKCCNIIDVIH